MLESLITSKTRLNLVLKFFLNPETEAYLRGLADEMGESTNGIRVELDRLSEASLLEKRNNGRTILYKANKSHPLFPELNSIVRKFFGIDKVVEEVLSKLGTVEMAFITGDYAKGIDSGIIDLAMVGKIDRKYLQKLVEKAEEMIHRKIRVLVLSEQELKKLEKQLKIDEALLVWSNGEKN